MRKEKMNRKNRRAKKLVVCTLLLALLTTGESVQNASFVFAETSDEEEYESFTDVQGIKYYSEDGISCSVQNGQSVTISDVKIPSTTGYNGKTYLVTEIDMGAFSGNKAIRTVEIENGIKEIGTSAFLECSNLQSVSIPDSVETMGISVFADSKNLKKVTLGKNIEGIEMTTFYGCSSLKSVTIPNSVTYIDAGAFYGCSLKSVTIPNSVTEIGKEAFKKNSNLTKVVIGNKLKNIGASAFEQDKKLKSITIKSTKLKSSSVGSKALTKTNSKLVIKVPAKKVTAYKKLFKGKGNKTVTVKKII